jgi:hypothetical protein
MGIMVNSGLTTAPGVRCRRIEDADAPAIAALLARGFAPRRTPQFWQDVIARLASRAVPADAPRYGYLLESNHAPVGALLQIFSTAPAGDADADAKPATRCSVSSWYVEPDFRSYAPLLVRQALKRRDVTYLNTSPAPHTRPIAEAQGYVRYSSGVFVAIPLLSRAPVTPARIIAAGLQPRAPHDPRERAVTEEHASFGCMSVWCETAERAYPFIFRPRWLKRFVRCAQLVYCRDLADFVRFARPLGFHLAARGWPLAMLDANGAISGLVGRYFDGIMPKYCKGPCPPRLGDLAYTEAALFGM